MTNYNVVILDDLLPVSHVEINELKRVGANVNQVSCKTVEDIARAAGDAHGVLKIYTRLTREAIGELKNCKVISHCGIGLDTVDLDAATEKGIVVTHVPVYCQEEVAGMAMTLLLACERRILLLDRMVKSGMWPHTIKMAMGTKSLKGKTLGLVGFGHIPRTLVPMARAFGLNVIATDPYVDKKTAEQFAVPVVNMDTLLKTADYISLHVPLNNETEYLIGRKEFSMMKEGAILINTARGKIIDQNALYNALKEGPLAFAGLDVLEYEPPQPDDPLLTLENVIITGHVAAMTIEAMQRLRLKAAQGVSAVLAGYWPEVVANPKVRKKISLSPWPGSENIY